MEIALFASSWAALGLVLVAWHLDQRRHDAQVRELLERISTEPRLELRPAVVVPRTDNTTRKYIADHVADDAAWNEFRGDTEEDDQWLS